MNDVIIKINSIIDNVLSEMYLQDKLNYEVKKEYEFDVLKVIIYPCFFNDLNENVFIIIDNFMSEIKILIDECVTCKVYKTYADYVNKNVWKYYNQ